MITERILQIIDFKGINKSRFYKETGLSNGFLDKVKDVGASKIELILKIYPEINPEWLITGNGKMLKDEARNNKIQVNDADLKDKYKELQKYLDEHQGNVDIYELLSSETENSILKGIIEDYKRQIIEKDKQIETLLYLLKSKQTQQ